MATNAKVVLLFFAVISAVHGLAKTEAAPKNETKSLKDKSVSKRQYGLQDTALWHHSNLALLNTGLLFSDYGLQHFPGNFPDLLRLQEGGYQGGHKTVHQLQDDVPTSPPRNPKKPVYHYTPLPPGTFPVPKPEDVNERDKIPNVGQSILSYPGGNIPNHNIFGYLVNTELNSGNHHGAYQTFPLDNRFRLVQYWPTPNLYHHTGTYS